MRFRRVLAGAAVAGLSAVSAGCSTGPTTGVLTGTAWACAGPRVAVHTAYLTVFRGSDRVAHAELPGGSTSYRFVLPPGQYTVTNTGVSYNHPNATVVAGETTHVNVPDLCK